MSDPRGRRGRIGHAWTILAWLAVAWSPPAGSQQAAGGIAGKLTDLHSRPLDGVTITLRNAASGTEVQTVSGKGGAYRFRGLEPGAYELVAASRLGRGTVGGLQVLAGHESRVQTALALIPSADSIAVSTPHPIAVPPASAGETRTSPAPVAPAPVAPAAVAAKTATRVEAQPPTILPARNAMATSTLHGEFASEDTAMMLLPSRAMSDGAVAAPAVRSAAAIPITRSGGNAPGALLAAVAASLARSALLATRAEILLDAASVSAEVDLRADQMEQLPLLGRRLESLVESAAPTRADAEDSDSTPARQTAFTVDGATTRLAFGGRMKGQEGRAILAAPGTMESAVQLFRVAELATPGSTGERIRMETRRGSDGLHGQVFLFSREGLLRAQNPFTPWVKESAPASSTTTPVFTAVPFSPTDTENRWGAGMGGTLRWHRVQWFGAADGSRRNYPAVATVRHPDHFFAQPSNDEMQVLSARLGLSGANPVGEGLKAYSGMLESLAGLLGPTARSSNSWSGFGRLDWRAGERHRFTLEGSEGKWNSPGGGMTRASETYGNHSFGGTRGSNLWAVTRWEVFVTSHLLLVTQGAMHRAVVERTAGTPSNFEQAFNASVWGQLPQMTVDSRYGFTIGNPARFGAGRAPDEQVYEAQQDLNWAHGPFLLRAGLDFRHSADATSMIRNHTGTYYYSSVENFISDALVFGKFGLADALDPRQQHNCDQRGRAWRDSTGQLRGLGYLPCYSHYTQTLGPTAWHLSTNDWAGFANLRWRSAKQLVLTAELRWDREDLPPPIALVHNPDLPLTQRLPALGNAWSPRIGLAWGRHESAWPVLRAGYGMYAGRTNNGLLETALTQTGSLQGNLKFFLRPTDNLQTNGGGAPPFPYVLAGQPGKAVKPAAVAFAQHFNNAAIHQGVVEMDEKLPGRILVSLSAMVSLARRLPSTMDTNYDASANPRTITYAVVDATGTGPIQKPQITVPFFGSWSGGSEGGRLNANYQQIFEIASRSNSTYEAATLRVSRYVRRGLSFHGRYTYGHAMDWNPTESAQVTDSTVFDPANFALEYGTSDQDQRHAASAMAIWQGPRDGAGRDRWLTNGWMISATAQFHSGMPYTMRTAGSITREFQANGTMVVGLGPGINGYGGDDRVYGVGRNTYRHPRTWKADVRMGRRFSLGHGRELELLAESFNLFNHQNVTAVETTGYYVQSGSTSGSLPTLNFLSGLKPGQTEFGLPLNINAVDFYRERQFDLGLRLRF